ncbi:MAG: radical SAM family heme chaperone HemW [Ruminococcaceae bacterium]|nr:radical SAM family heme chaperone HemW [Oscillospiraceae bacterium]
MSLFSPTSKKPLGIYIHVPFCRSKCHYCDFYSVTDMDILSQEGYLDAVCDHIRETGPLAPDYLVDTVYFGGGTPSYFGAEGLAVILSTIRRSFHIASDAEITFEANPDSITPKLLRRLRSEGFNRVSLGVQCDDDEILQTIGRPHSYDQAVEAVRLIRKAGYKNLSLDLIYGLPEQDLERWQRTLSNVLELKPEHISCYGLKLEEGTPLCDYQQQFRLPDDDMQADMYLATVELLRSRGYRQYEISNFCKRGRESRHNMKYWTGGEYLGFGPNASSDFAGQRFTVIRDLPGYITGIRSGGQVLQEVQTVPQRERAGEYLMMHLRTTYGISGEEYEKKFLLPFAPLEKALEQCRGRGHALRGGDGRWHLTAEGFLLSNSIITDLLLLQEKSRTIDRRK